MQKIKQLCEKKNMKMRSVLTIVFALLSVIFLPLNSGFSQHTSGRWALGFHAGGNMWINDYKEPLIGPGGEIMLRYGISSMFSAGVVAGYEEMKSEESPIPGGPGYLKLHAIPASVTAWVHFAPGQYVNPYVYAGIGAMIYKTLDAYAVYYPNSQFQSTIHMPFGVGVEVFATNKFSIVGDVGYRVTDNYPDALDLGKVDGYATAKVGFNLYLGTSDADEDARLWREAEDRRLRDLAEAEARRVKQQADADAEARRLKDLADAEARRLKDLADAKARQVKQSDNADAEARRLKDLADAEARRLRDLADAEARRLKELNDRDTIIILEKGKTVVLKGVNFEFNKATLTMDSEIILERAHRALHASPDLSVLITGHTDNVGSAEYNKKLSFRRAEAVKSWLVRKGISVKRLSIAGKGFDEPIDDNTTDEGRANNRRIEFHVLE